jgi:hypothetical protein
MPKVLHLELDKGQRAELEAVRDHHPRPHLREKAAALLKIADGMPASQVARHGLLKPREPDTVYRWLARFTEAGIAGLAIRDGRGRKAAFSPSARHRRPTNAVDAAASDP